MRPSELARRHGLSTQAVRNYEAAGVLPPAQRTASGYRHYTQAHALALDAFVGLVPGHGHAVARAIMTAAVGGRLDGALDLIDRSHAELLAARRTVDAVEAALGELGGRTFTGPPIPIGALAHRIALVPATVRRWEAAGLLHPSRGPDGHRRYSPDDVRDAHLVRQLRRAGTPLAAIGPVLDDLRGAGGPDRAAAALAERRRAHTAQARAMLAGAAALWCFVRHLAG